jgi:SAM-dependent methyltransferase
VTRSASHLRREMRACTRLPVTDLMSACLAPVYQVYFRTHRGGCGIDFDAASTEFRLVTSDLGVTGLDPFPARMRLRFHALEGAQDQLVERMGLLGYSQALVRLDRQPGQGVGRTVKARLRWERWLAGAQRVGDDIVVFTELWSADEGERRRSAPHRRRFPFAYPRGPRAGLGRRGERRLSPCDARFLLNLSQAKPGQRVLDPFAGIGGIVLQAAARGITTVCGDLEEALRLGLAQISGGRACVWDACALPLRDGCVEVVVTEPPYSPALRQAVAATVPEMARCLCPGGRLVALMDEPLSKAVRPAVEAQGLSVEHEFRVRRQGFLARAVCWIKAGKGGGFAPVRCVNVAET